MSTILVWWDIVSHISCHGIGSSLPNQEGNFKGESEHLGVDYGSALAYRDGLGRGVNADELRDIQIYIGR